MAEKLEQNRNWTLSSVNSVSLTSLIISKKLLKVIGTVREKRGRWQKIKSKKRKEERKTEREGLMDGGMDARTNESMYLLLTKPLSVKRQRDRVNK